MAIYHSFGVTLPATATSRQVTLQRTTIRKTLDGPLRAQWAFQGILGYMTIWLVVGPYPSEKYESVGMMKFPIYGKIKNMFQSTNQKCTLTACQHVRTCPEAKELMRFQVDSHEKQQKMVWFKFPKQHWKLDYSYPNKKKCFNVINHYFNANLIFLSFKRFCSPLLLGNDPREQSRRASLMLLAPPWVTKASQRRSAETWT